jgi:fructoselysine-6-P-deglycase FrlB-like protein
VFQGALTFKELVKVQAECKEAAQFRHGPLERLTSGW